MSELLANTLVFQRQNSRLSRLVTGAKRLWYRVKSAVAGLEPQLPIHDVKTLSLSLQKPSLARLSALWDDAATLVSTQVRTIDRGDVNITLARLAGLARRQKTIELHTADLEGCEATLDINHTMPLTIADLELNDTRADADSPIAMVDPVPAMIDGKLERVNLRIEADHNVPQNPNIGGRYRLLEEIGKGGFGRVYRAFDNALQKQVAIKVMREENRVSRASFAAELAVANEIGKGLRNVVDCLAAGENFIVLEYLEGMSLHNYLHQNRGSLTTDSLIAALKIIREVLFGLESLDKQNIIHADISPDNVQINWAQGALTPQVKLLDPSHGRLYEQRRKPGNIFGKPRWAPPEMLRNEELDRRADVFSVGLILYNLLSGRQPFEEINQENQHNPDVDPYIDIALRRAQGEVFGFPLPIVERSEVEWILGKELKDLLPQIFRELPDGERLALMPGGRNAIEIKLADYPLQKQALLFLMPLPYLLNWHRIPGKNNLHQQIEGLVLRMTGAKLEPDDPIKGDLRFGSAMEARVAVENILRELGISLPE